MRLDVKRCPRCLGEHLDMHFRKLTKPSTPIDSPAAKPYTRWTMCPLTHEPIMYAPEALLGDYVVMAVT